MKDISLLAIELSTDPTGSDVDKFLELILNNMGKYDLIVTPEFALAEKGVMKKERMDELVEKIRKASESSGTLVVAGASYKDQCKLYNAAELIANGTVQEYLKEAGMKTAEEAVDESTALTKTGDLDPDINKALVAWITRMQMVLSVSEGKIIARLMIDEKNVDGSVLQLATFVLQDFFEGRKKSMPFEKLQPLTGSILQAVLQPFMKEARKVLAEQQAEEEDDIDEV